jgi:polysaccharide export outer membrane protein
MRKRIVARAGARDLAAAATSHVSALLMLLAVVGASALSGCGESLTNQFEVTQSGQNGGNGLTAAPAETKEAALHLPPSAQALTSTGTPGNTAYKIGPQDVLDIAVYKAPELGRSVQVADTGTVNLPLLGEVQAAGKTARQLEHDLASKLGAKYLQSPQVAVQVKEYNSQRVTVEGAVKNPGVHALKSKTSLLQLVAISGGLDSTTSDSTVVVFRQIDGKRYAARFKVDEIRKGQAEDPPILPGDVVVANSSAIKSAWGDFLKALPVASFAMLLL